MSERDTSELELTEVSESAPIAIGVDFGWNWDSTAIVVGPA